MKFLLNSLALSLLFFLVSIQSSIAQNAIPQSGFAGNGSPIKVTDFNGAQRGFFKLDLNFLTNTYNTKAHMSATVDLSRDVIMVSSYSHFASDKTNDPLIGNRTSELTTQSDAYCKFKIYLSNNTLYISQIMNPGGPGAMLRLEPSSWKMNNEVSSSFAGNGSPIKITDFNGATNGVYLLDLNFLTNTYNTRAHMKATVNLSRKTITVNRYSHFASDKKNDPVLGSGTSMVTTDSEAYCKFKIYFSNNTLYAEQIMNPGGPGAMLKLEPSSWLKR